MASAPLLKARKMRVIDQHVVARDFGVELDGRGAARGNQRGLHVFLEVRAAFVLHLVEDLADHVEARHEVRSAVADEHADVLAGLRLQRAAAR